MKKVTITCLIIAIICGLMVIRVTAGTQGLEPAQQNISLNFKQVELTDAFRALADVAEMNVITDNSVPDEEITIHLQNISFFEAVELLARTNGLDYKVTNNTVLIAQEGELKAGFQEQKTQIFELENASPSGIKESITSVVEEENIKIDQRTDSLVITGYEAQLNQIENLIKSLDESKKQVVIQTRIEEISHKGLEELGIDWDFGSVQLGSGDDFDGDPSLEIGNMGIDMDYSATLDMLEEKNKATVLANPQITTLEGREASINIGDEVPIVEGDSEDNLEVSFKDVGINLNIKPEVGANDQVTIDVTPEVSVVNEYIETQGGRYPVVSSRKAQTNVKVESGQTIALGGLIQEEEIQTMSQVPILGDLPMLGKLFETERSETEKKELIIFLTPQIIESNSTEETTETETGAREAEFEPGIVPIDYEVEEEETLWGIGEKFNVFYAEIKSENNLQSQGGIQVGDVLEVPIPKRYYYRVQKEDTLTEIAEKYDIKVDRIKEINKIDSLEGEYGQKLILPTEVKPQDRVIDFSKDKEAYREHLEN